jgi:hypothetical protein
VGPWGIWKCVSSDSDFVKNFFVKAFGSMWTCIWTCIWAHLNHFSICMGFWAHDQIVCGDWWLCNDLAIWFGRALRWDLHKMDYYQHRAFLIVLLLWRTVIMTAPSSLVSAESHLLVPPQTQSFSYCHLPDVKATINCNKSSISKLQTPCKMQIWRKCGSFEVLIFLYSFSW